MATKAKQVLLTLVQHDWGENERTVAYVRATKQGKQAEVHFFDDEKPQRFEDIHKAHSFLCRTYYGKNPMTFFRVPQGVVYPIG